MKITSVEPQKKNKGRFNIFLDGVFGFGADEDTVVKFRLIPGKQLDNSELEVILLETEVGKLMTRVYGLLNIRQRSEKEVRDYFRIKNYEARIKGREEISQILVDKVIETLKQKGFINDEVFAKAWVESRTKKKGWRVIQSELIQKGIDREIIESIKEQVLSFKDESQTAKNLLEKKAGVWKNLPKLEFRKKALEFLMRRGFDYSTAKDTVDSYLEKM